MGGKIMTLRDFFNVSEFKTSFTLDLGNGDEISMSKEDDVLINAIGDIVIDRIFLPPEPCKVCAKTVIVREGV